MPDRASKNRTLSRAEEEIAGSSREILKVGSPVSREDVESRVAAGDMVAKCFPEELLRCS